MRTELFQLLVIRLLAHHLEQLHCQSAGHGDSRNLPSRLLGDVLRSVVIKNRKCRHSESERSPRIAGRTRTEDCLLLGENLGAVNIQLKAYDLQEINSAAAKIEAQERISPAFNVSYQLQIRILMGNILLVMARTEPPLLPRISRLLRGYGENLKLARLRRRYSAETVAQRVGISRKTLSRVEKGDSAVALGIYARVMQVLRLEEDLARLAVDDPLGRKLQDTGLSPKRRAPKRPPSSPPPLSGTTKPKEMP